MDPFQDFYPQALVPTHLTKLTVDKLPFDEPFYTAPGKEDDPEEPPAIFVGPDRSLKMSKYHSIDPDNRHLVSPLGMVGIMRTCVITPSSVKDAFVADLRFIDDYQLADLGEAINDCDDQEEYMDMVAYLGNSVTFEAFIAPEQITETDDDMPRDAFYGDQELYGATATLQEYGNELLEQYREEQERRRQAAAEARKQKKAKNKSRLP